MTSGKALEEGQQQEQEQEQEQERRGSVEVVTNHPLLLVSSADERDLKMTSEGNIPQNFSFSSSGTPAGGAQTAAMSPGEMPWGQHPVISVVLWVMNSVGFTARTRSSGGVDQVPKRRNNSISWRDEQGGDLVNDYHPTTLQRHDDNMTMSAGEASEGVQLPRSQYSHTTYCPYDLSDVDLSTEYDRSALEASPSPLWGFYVPITPPQGHEHTINGTTSGMYPRQPRPPPAQLHTYSVFGSTSHSDPNSVTTSANNTPRHTNHIATDYVTSITTRQVLLNAHHHMNNAVDHRK